MTEESQALAYRLYGSETSAFSDKLRAYMKYKGMECQWITRNAACEDELQAVSRFDTIPVLVTPSGYAAHDTTAVIEALENDFPEQSTSPEESGIAFLAAVLEEYADTWLSKAVMQYRWIRKKDQKKAAIRVIDEYFPDGTGDQDREELEKLALKRMNESVSLIGLNAEIGAIVEKSAGTFSQVLAAHLENYDYIFGGRPSIADFALSAQIAQLRKDSIPARLMEKAGPALKTWNEQMENPIDKGSFLPLAVLRDGLKDIFCKEISVNFLPWAAANIEAALAGEEQVKVSLGRRKIVHAPIASAGRSFRDLRRKFSRLADEETRLFLDEVGATPFLLRPPRTS